MKRLSQRLGLSLALVLALSGVAVQAAASHPVDHPWTGAGTGTTTVVGPSQETLWGGPRVLLAQPDQPPPAVLAEALRSACEQDPQVAAAYVFLAAAPGAESHAQAVLGLELSAGEEISDELIAALQAAGVPPADAAAGLEGYASLDVRVLDEGILDWAREFGLPIYRRPAS